jgi:hypothetical protein
MNDAVIDIERTAVSLDRSEEEALSCQFSDADLEAAAITERRAVPVMTAMALTASFRCCTVA